MNVKKQTVIPPGTPITVVPAGKAGGLSMPLMRTRGERGTESRLPRARPSRSRKPYTHTPQDLTEPAIKTPVGWVKPVGITAKWSGK